MKNKIAGAVAGLSITASIIMWTVGSNDSALTELKDFFWVPLPLALICGILACKSCKKCD